MDDFLSRLYDEKQQLDYKIGKLKLFINSEKFNSIELNQRLLLRSQVKTMEAYSEILDHRIFLLSPCESVN